MFPETCVTRSLLLGGEEADCECSCTQHQLRREGVGKQKERDCMRMRERERESILICSGGVCMHVCIGVLPFCVRVA